MQLSCEVCHAPLRAEDVRLELAVARCHSCNAVYDLSGRKGRGLAAPASKPPRLIRSKIPLPKRFRVDDGEHITRITWWWFEPPCLLLLLFCIVWDGLLLYGYGDVWAGKAPLIVLIMLVVHTAGAVGVTYTTLAYLVNRTRIEASREQLTIRHGPVPWFGNKRVPGHQLSQLYGKEIALKTEEGRKFHYDLMARDRDGQEIELLSGLDEKDHVLYLEQELERRLGIEDVPVEGETVVRARAS